MRTTHATTESLGRKLELELELELDPDSEEGQDGWRED